MKHIIATVLAIFIMSLSAAAQKTYSVSKDEQTGAQVFKGPITFEDLNAEPGFAWMKRGEAAYKPDPQLTAALAKRLAPYTIVTVMGTWCDDSQNLVPKLAKVLSAAQFPASRFLMYGVDRAKETGGIERKLYSIEKVPTIIVFRGNSEVGRITESVQKSVEADLLSIVQ